MRIFVIGLWLEILALGIQLSRLTAAERDWRTDSERSNYLRTPRYAETIHFLQRLDSASTELKMVRFGSSGAHRDLWVAIISKSQYFEPSRAHASNLPIVLLNNCIHPGESEGKDACLAFARDLLIRRKYPEILDHCILLIIPIFNADGHERFGPYNRLNQQGPMEMGWRVTVTNLNLNRDFVKAETPEMRAWLTLFNQWLPHLFIDCHTTDGADFQYDILYNIDTHPEFGGAVSIWARDHFLPRLLVKCEQKGHILGPYAGLIDPLHPEKGLRGGVWTPRLSNPYVTLRNRAGLLLETHSLKDYRTRVIASYDFILSSLEALLENPRALATAIAQEDNTCQQFGQAKTTFPLVFRLADDQGDSILYRGYEIEVRPGIISGQDYLTYRPIPRDIPAIYFNQVRATLSVPVPLGYLVPIQWHEIITVLRAHGLKLYQTTAPVSGTFEVYQFKNPRWATQSYEGRLRLEFDTESVTRERTFPRGTIYAPTAQPGAKVLLYLLEPQCSDALIHWGFFNAIFEQKEYFEDYVMEPLAQKMAQASPQLKAEFESRLATDSSFAASPYRRLQFFYLHSPYQDPEQNVYPIVRVTRPNFLNLEPF